MPDACRNDAAAMHPHPHLEERKKESLSANADRAQGEANEDPKAAFWRIAKTSLSKLTGKSDQQCGALIGRWLKTSDLESVINAITAATKEQPADPVAWISAAIKTRTKTPARPRELRKVIWTEAHRALESAGLLQAPIADRYEHLRTIGIDPVSLQG
jgi:hypothetical protein